MTLSVGWHEVTSATPQFNVLVPMNIRKIVVV